MDTDGLETAWHQVRSFLPGTAVIAIASIICEMRRDIHDAKSSKEEVKMMKQPMAIHG